MSYAVPLPTMYHGTLVVLRPGTAPVTVVVAGALPSSIAMPLATALCCAGFGVTGPAAGVALLFSTMPTAPSAYILARQLGGDAPLMAGIIALQTLVAALAIPLVLTIAGGALR